MDHFSSKIRISELGTDFDDISFDHCCDLTSEEEHQYSIEEILVDLLEDYCDYRVLIFNFLNTEYFNLNERVAVHDNIFELRAVIVSRNVKNYKWRGDIFS